MAMLPDAADPHLPHVLAARAKDEDTDLRQFVDLVNAICLEHLAVCVEMSIRRGVALPPGSDAVIDAAAWLAEIRQESQSVIARRVSEGLAVGLRRLEAERAEAAAAAGSKPKRRKPGRAAKSICG